MITTESDGFFSWLLPWDCSVVNDTKSNSLKYCHFCMDVQTCRSCMAAEPVYIPREMHLQQAAEKKRVC